MMGQLQRTWIAMSTSTSTAVSPKYAIILVLVFASVTVYFAYYHYKYTPSSKSFADTSATQPMAGAEDGDTDENEEGEMEVLSASGTLSDLIVEEVPRELQHNKDISSIVHRSHEVEIDSEIKIEGATGSLFYREAIEEGADGQTKGDILLLHGAAFSAKTWLAVGTLQQLAKLRYRVYAIDLPGYGMSRTVTYSGEPSMFIVSVIKALGLDHPVLISPSMSGEYALPVVIKHPEVVRGFVAIAPTSTGKFTKEEYSNCQVPTLVVYGELDKGLGLESLENLQHLPNRFIEQLERANHPAYLDQPQRWHELLYSFLRKIDG
ncbi:putative protein-lysine deacylase ABHD14B [Ptychodera flava]|uniref:putative protein-lysine deacylase ABHD14B n=1 Tax=Ptychodera flava TaxID=63121 RepID=UPI00396A8C8E